MTMTEAGSSDQVTAHRDRTEEATQGNQPLWRVCRQHTRQRSFCLSVVWGFVFALLCFALLYFFISTPHQPHKLKFPCLQMRKLQLQDINRLMLASFKARLKPQSDLQKQCSVSIMVVIERLHPNSEPHAIPGKLCLDR